MAATRHTNFTFYSQVNLTMRTNDTFYFADRTAQATFFASKVLVSNLNCSYQRDEVNRVRVNQTFSTMYKCDYLSFINTDYENKRFYAFVTGVNYISDSVTELTFVVDVIQTWFLDLTLKPCFIERQHTPTDNIGDNILPESLDLGELVDMSINAGIDTRTCVVVVTTFDIATYITSGFVTKQSPPISIRSGMYDLLDIGWFFSDIAGTPAAAGSGLAVFFANVLSGQGGVTVDDIINVYVFPRIGISYDSNLGAVTVPGATQGNDYNNFYRAAVVTPQTQSFPARPLTIDGYAPKNNKLFTYPYCLLHVTNNDGSAIDLKYEKFRDGNYNIIANPQFKIFGTTSGEAKIRLVPQQYLGESSTVEDFEFGIDSSAFPTVAMLGDPYILYLAQNKNRIENNYAMLRNSVARQVVGAEAGAISSATGGAGAGALIPYSVNLAGIASSFFDNISKMEAQFDDMKISPATASGISGVGLNYQNGRKDFSLITKTVDRIHAKMIDDYFSMFGYSIKKVDTPNVHARTAYTFVKTQGCVLHGNAPATVKATIAGLFDSGIRFWASQSNIGDFSTANPVITPNP